MKSLVALLDRKKRDRANTLVQVPFPSTLPHPTSQQELPVPLPGSRRTSTPPTFLRPPLQHRESSNASLAHHPLFSESPTYSRGHSPAQSTSYYTDSDDGTIADPFAASPAKVDLTSSKAPPHQLYDRRGSEPNSTNIAPSRSFRIRATHEPSAALPVKNESASQSGATTSGGKRRWLRERRSLTSLLRPQPSAPSEPVPTMPPLPTASRVPERKASFFTRGRSGSTPPSAQAIEQAHTSRRPSAASTSAHLQTPVTHRPSRNSESGGTSRLFVPPTVESPTTFDSPDSWVRVGGVGREESSPKSPTNVRRRAVSVPARARPPQPTEPCPPVPRGEHCLRAPNSESGHSTTVPRPPLVCRPGPSTEHRARPNVHGARSTSVSVPSSSNTGTRSIDQERRSLKHVKQSSMSASEGLVLKSALKHRPVEQSIQDHQSSHLEQVKPLKISKREGADSSQLPTPSSDSSLKALERATAFPSDTDRAGGRQPSSTSTIHDSSPGSGTLSDPSNAPVLGTAGSFGTIMRGHGLATSDSRSLPVLDNIWGSFISETAFGSLPPSPVASANTKHRATKSHGSAVQGLVGHSPASSYSSSSSSHPPSLQGQWQTGSAPPTLPPVSGLPPVPSRPSPAPTLSLGSVPRRKRSRSTNASMLLTPPISPTAEIEFQGLDLVMTTSASGSSVSGTSVSSNEKPSVPSQPVLRLTRSNSSPIIRSPTIPAFGPGNVQEPNTTSWLSVKVSASRSPSPSSGSQASSQCTTVPGTPIVLPLSTTNSAPSDLGASIGQLVPPSPDLLAPRGSVDYTRPPQQPGPGRQLNPNISSPDSVAILGMFPSVPNQAWSQAQEEASNTDIGQGAGEDNQGEKPLLTPPVTPAWVAQVFGPSPEDDLNGSDGEHSSERGSLTRSGSLAQIRRQKRHGTRSSLSEHVRGHPTSLPGPQQVNARCDRMSVGAMRSSRNAV